jgi:antirestriction protein ArdC/phage/plasmid primase-like uncharacterized protein
MATESRKAGGEGGGESYAEKVAAKIIEQMQQGTAPWMKPWKPGELQVPFNPQSGKPYRGINSMWLMMQGHGDPRWMTYKQAAAEGAQVKRGEKGTVIQYWKFRGMEPETDEKGKPVLDEDGKKKMKMVEYQRPRVFHAVVFNAEQIDGLPPLQARPKTDEWERHERCEKILAASGVPITHGGSGAYYEVVRDRITMPDRDRFDSADGYYATALHELGHATGHPSRLNRDLANPFGSEAYAKEELRAEIASLMLGQQLDIGHDPGQHVAYVGSWIRALQNDPREIFRAAADAEKITEFVMGIEQQQEQQQAAAQARAGELGGRLGPAPAYMTDDSTVIDWTSGENLGAAWRGVCRSDERFWLISTADDYDRAFTQLNATNYADAIQEVSANHADKLQPHALTLEQYQKQVTVEALENHGRKYSVQLDHRYTGFSDAETPEDAVKDVHRAAVWNALLMPALGAHSFVDPPPPHVLADYPGITEEVAAAALPPPEALNAAYAKAAEAEAVFTAETERAYGAEASEKRYLPKHDDPAVQAAAEAKKAADAELHAITQHVRAERASGAPVEHTPAENHMRAEQRIDLIVPYKEKDQAKAAGARWDKQGKTWYAPEGADMAKLARWTAEAQRTVKEPKQDPESEFADALKQAGFRLDEGQWLGQTKIHETTPQMDGKLYRVRVEGDEGTERSGTYIGHLDGHPAGYIHNFRTGLVTNWKSSQKADTLSDADRARLAAEAAEKLAAREAEQAARHESTARALLDLMTVAPPARQDHPYLVKKGLDDQPSLLVEVPQDARDLSPDSPVKIAANRAEATKLREQFPESPVFTAGDLLVGAFDRDGNLTTVQAIGPDGMKANAAGGKLGGSYYSATSGPAAEQPGLGNGIVIAEGWATGETIRRACGGTVVVAFNAGNLETVAKTIREQHPDRPILIAGDNDHQREREINPLTGQPKVNQGKESAMKAAAAVGGYAVIPEFAAESKGTDWNDWRKEHGDDALRKAMTESMLLADRRQLADAHRHGHDAERVDLNIREHQAQAEQEQGQAPTASIAADMKSAYADLRRKADNEVDRQDKSDELYNGQPAPAGEESPEVDQEQQQAEVQKPAKKRSSGRSRSR